MYGKGISREGSLLDVGVDLGIVKKSGAWFTYEGEQLGQGRENAKQFLSENIDMMVEISEKIRQEVGIDDVPEADACDADRRRRRPTSTPSRSRSRAELRPEVVRARSFGSRPRTSPSDGHPMIGLHHRGGAGDGHQRRGRSAAGHDRTTHGVTGRLTATRRGSRASGASASRS